MMGLCELGTVVVLDLAQEAAAEAGRARANGRDGRPFPSFVR